jgi:hypothetical protein
MCLGIVDRADGRVDVTEDAVGGGDSEAEGSVD